jgi:hypothetical protein
VLIALTALDGLLAIAARALLWTANAGLLREDDLLRQGNAVLNGGLTLSGAVGPIVAGTLVAGVGITWALALDAASFAVAALVLAIARSLPIDSESAGAGWRARLRAGLQYARRERRIRLLLTFQGVALVFFTLVVPIEIVFVKAQLHAGDTGYGLLLASWGTGMLIGAGVFAVSRRISVLWLLVVSSIAIAISYLGIAASPTLLAACAASLIGGIGNGVEWVALLTALQAATSPDRQVVVMALFESLSTVMPGVGFAIGGAITALSSPRAAYATAGGGLLVLIGLALLTIARQRRSRERVGVR